MSYEESSIEPVSTASRLARDGEGASRLARDGEGASRLARDDRGAVMLLGIFMCATLVGALWYLAGIGDAIVYRERLQEAADAAAMSAAVLNARGMNLLVFINLIMACVLAIRVALKTLEVTLVIAETIFGGCVLVPEPFNPFEVICGILLPLTGEAITDVQELIDQTRDPINNALKGLHNAQKAIARVVPGASVLGSLEVIHKYSPFIVETPPLTFPVPSLASPSTDRLSKGLPVVDGSTDILCGKAGKAMGALIDTLNPLPLDGAKGMFSDALESVAKAGSGFFCELGGSGGKPDFSSLTNKTANDKCDKEIEKRQHELDTARDLWKQECTKDGVTCLDVVDDPFLLDRGGSATRSDMSGPAFDAMQKSTKAEDKAKLTQLNSLKGDRDAKDDALNSFNKTNCVNAEKKNLNQQLNKVPASPAGNGNGMEPMKVDPAWFNGSPQGQTLSFVNAEDSLLKRSFRGVRVGAWNAKHTPDKIKVPLLAQSAYAQAEYFYDCGTAYPSPFNGPGWKDCNKDEEAMWHLRWRARLRRYNAPWDPLVPFDKALTAELTARAILEGGDLVKSGKGSPENMALRVRLGQVLANTQSLKGH